MEIVFLLIGLIIGAIGAWLISKYKFKSTQGISTEEVKSLEDQIDNLKIENGKFSERNQNLQETLTQTTEELKSERQKVIELNSSLSSLKSDYNNLQEKLTEQKGEIEELQQKFTQGI